MPSARVRGSRLGLREGLPSLFDLDSKTGTHPAGVGESGCLPALGTRVASVIGGVAPTVPHVAQDRRIRPEALLAHATA